MEQMDKATDTSGVRLMGHGYGDIALIRTETRVEAFICIVCIVLYEFILAYIGTSANVRLIRELNAC